MKKRVTHAVGVWKVRSIAGKASRRAGRCCTATALAAYDELAAGELPVQLALAAPAVCVVENLKAGVEAIKPHPRLNRG